MIKNNSMQKTMKLKEIYMAEVKFPPSTHKFSYKNDVAELLKVALIKSVYNRFSSEIMIAIFKMLMLWLKKIKIN